MNDTPSLSLPLLLPSQAQKHVTVNEALIRLDGLTQLRLQSRNLASPPEGEAVDGDCYSLPLGCTGDWYGLDGMVAIGSNGGWVFAQPLAGWRAWISDEHCTAVFENGSWQVGWIGGSSSGSASRISVYEAEFAVASGGGLDLPLVVPKDSMVFACAARVVEELTGSLVSWDLGIPGESGKFGSGLGISVESYCTGILSQPTTYYADTPIQLVPNGGSISGGRLRLALHCYQISLPA